MATKKTPEFEEVSTRRVKPAFSVMKMPEEIPKQFGVQAHDETQAQGIAETKDLRDLAAVFGVNDAVITHLPFQKFGASDGKRFELRIEPSGSHAVEGALTVGHPWMFRQVYPEMRA